MTSGAVCVVASDSLHILKTRWLDGQSINYPRENGCWTNGSELILVWKGMDRGELGWRTGLMGSGGYSHNISEAYRQALYLPSKSNALKVQVNRSSAVFTMDLVGRRAYLCAQ